MDLPGAVQQGTLHHTDPRGCRAVGGPWGSCPVHHLSFMAPASTHGTYMQFPGQGQTASV